MQLSPTLMNTLADAIDTAISTAGTGEARFLNTAVDTVYATIVCNNPVFGAASGGVITLDVDPAVQDVTPEANGTATRLGFYTAPGDADSAWVVLLGIATTGDPDVTMSNNVIATSDTVQISSLTVAVPSGSVDVT